MEKRLSFGWAAVGLWSGTSVYSFLYRFVGKLGGAQCCQALEGADIDTNYIVVLLEIVGT